LQEPRRTLPASCEEIRLRTITLAEYVAPRGRWRTRSSAGPAGVDGEVVATIPTETSAPDAASCAGAPAPAPPLGVQIAPSSPMACAARAFGDDYPPISRHWLVRLAGIAYVVSAIIYVPWLFASLDRHLPWLAWPFLVANVFTMLTTLLSVYNHWCRAVPERRPLAHGDERLVGIIIPCCGEPVGMVLRTVTSVIEQDWPLEQMAIVVSDDGHDPALARALRDWPVLYHSPPDRFAPGRDGAAKAGNLNSAFAMLVGEHPQLAYVETRDCDDELGSTAFLREVIGQLESEERLAYVQTIKESQVSAGDPFNNREAMFYRGQMLSRNAANATFPCGSGVVWRRAALDDIGLFPTWNLVEDLQSGVEALRRGWRGRYLPIVGAMGQHSPEDVPNVYKQRGTWAIDTVRLMVWGELRGLSLRQRAQFYELLGYYLHSFTVLVYVPSIICALLGYVPFKASGESFLIHMLPIVLATEAWLLAINRPYNDRRRRQRHPVRELWRVRIIWSGMAPVFMKASLQAILGGRHRKPVYRVTRKHDDPRWHWGHTLPQTSVLLLVAFTVIYAASHRTLPRLTLLLPFVYWGGLYVALFAGFVARSWYGVRSLRRAVVPVVSAGVEPRAEVGAQLGEQG
jgi:cellulose synthase (UDP-forming)